MSKKGDEYDINQETSTDPLEPHNTSESVSSNFHQANGDHQEESRTGPRSTLTGSPKSLGGAPAIESGQAQSQRNLESALETEKSNGHVSSGTETFVECQSRDAREYAKEHPSRDEHFELRDILDRDDPVSSTSTRNGASAQGVGRGNAPIISEWSHQQLAPHHEDKDKEHREELGWQEMPAYAEYDMFDDDGKLIARAVGEAEDDFALPNRGGAGKGYTKVQLDEDAQSATSLDDKTAYLFKEQTTQVDEEDEEARDPMAQMQTTKDLLDDNQRVAYVGIVRLAMAEMLKQAESIEKTRAVKKQADLAVEHMKMWSQKIMFRLYQHIELDPAEQIMIEQLADHGLQPADLSPALMQNSKVKNPMARTDEKKVGHAQPDEEIQGKPRSNAKEGVSFRADAENDNDPPPQYQESNDMNLQSAEPPPDFSDSTYLDLDLRWTVLCDLFLTLISDSVYDSRSRVLLERVGSFLDVDWLEVCRFEKRVTEALEMQEAQDKENWNEEEHLNNRDKLARRKKLIMMGLATAGGGLIIGLSCGVLAPAIGTGLAAGFTALGISGTSSVMAGGGMAALFASSGAAVGGLIGGKSMSRRAGAVRVFEYKPLHNNKRVNLVVTVSGWLIGKVDDVRLPFSTVDPMMGDVYSILWEPDMLKSMGQTIGILATEALTQSIQQILGGIFLSALMAALYVPVLLGKLVYLIDNPWSVSCARADRAGLVLADSLIDRNLGARPITLVGYSIGARVVFSALQELARKGAVGLVQNVYLFGTPLVAKKDKYLQARTVIAGRFLNGYATNDWILGYLFRATSGGIMRVAGLAPVQVEGVENVNLTSLVKGHMAYRNAMPRLLREVGWAVTSDEFAEIEDPDPDNHDARQRQLINEIEEARQELKNKPEKKRRFGFLANLRKKNAEKKPWEIYSEDAANTKEPMEKGTGKENTYDSYDAYDADYKGSGGLQKEKNLNEACKDNDDGVLFDVEAIRKEAVSLAAQGLEVKQLESTLPPLKIDSTIVNSGEKKGLAPSDRPVVLREAKSFDAASGPPPYSSLGARDNNPDSSRSFDIANHEPKYLGDFSSRVGDSGDDEVEMTFERPNGSVKSLISPEMALDVGQGTRGDPKVRENVWAEDEEFGKEKEMSMTFE